MIRFRMEDLGEKFGRDHSFYFDNIIIDEILFDDTDDITLYCRVKYFAEEYTATIGLGFDQLNTILRSMRSISNPIATALAEKLEEEELEIPTTINLKDIYHKGLEVTTCFIKTTLYELGDEDDDFEEEEEDGGDDFAPGFDKNTDDENDYIAYAFMVDEIILKPKK